MRPALGRWAAVLLVGVAVACETPPAPLTIVTSQPEGENPPATSPQNDRTPTPSEATTATPDLPTPTSSPTLIPSRPYVNEEYLFRFDVPAGWVLQESAQVGPDGEAPLRESVRLSKGPYQITVEYNVVREEVQSGPGGLPAGTLREAGEILFLGKPVGGYAVVSDEKTKMVFYESVSEDLRLFVGLEMLIGADPGSAYEDVDLPPEIQADLAALLASFARTGTLDLPESVALIDSFPVILPMQNYYYSQIYDTAWPNACGPASAMMVLDYFGLEDSLEAVIQTLMNLPTPGAYDPTCTVNAVCTSPEALAMGIRGYGLTVVARDNWTLEDVHKAVSAGHPVIADILFQGSRQGPGHFVVIYGLDLDGERLFFHDPFEGRERISSWQDFAVAWEGLVDRGDPLRPEGHRFWGIEIMPAPPRPTDAIPRTHML